VTPKEHEIILKSHELWAERGTTMFTNPIKHTRIKDFKELLKFSYCTKKKAEKPFIYWQEEGQIAFSTHLGEIWVTPYREEIPSILKEAYFAEEKMQVPSFEYGEIPEEYGWLLQIAEEENFAATHEKAFKRATEKGIKEVELKQKVHVKEVVGWYEDEESNARYDSMTMMHLAKGTEKNIATYIVVDEKVLLICDEYGRTFLVKVKTVINDIVNSLIDAGYTRTAHPEKYIHFHKTPAAR